MESRLVMVEDIYDHPLRHGPGIRFEVWCKPQDDDQPNYIVASTFDPFTADLLYLAKQLTESVTLTTEVDERGLTDIVRLEPGPRVEDWHLRQATPLAEKR